MSNFDCLNNFVTILLTKDCKSIRIIFNQILEKPYYYIYCDIQI